MINLTGESIGGSSLLNLRWTRERKKRILESRINAGEILSKAIENVGSRPKVFIQISAVGYYGTEDQSLLDEESEGGDDFLARVCQVAENSSESVEEMGVRRIVTRLGVVLCEENPIIGYMAMPFKMYIGGNLGNGKQFFSWIHIEDLIEIFKKMLMSKEYEGVYNLTASRSIPNSDVSEILGTVLKKPNWFPTPAFGLKLLLGEASALILGGQNVQPKRLLESEYKYKFENLEDAFRDVLT